MDTVELSSGLRSEITESQGTRILRTMKKQSQSVHFHQNNIGCLTSQCTIDTIDVDHRVHGTIYFNLRAPL